MAEASNGLRNALARAKSGAVAISEMQAADIMTALSDEQKVSLAAALAASTPTASQSAGQDPAPEDEEDPDMPDSEEQIAAARADERQRFTTVMASDHYIGREGLAATLLASDKMTADEIVTALAAAPKAAAEPAESAGDPEAAARAEMQAAIAATGNSSVDAGGADAASKATKSKAASEAWDRVYADLHPKSAN